MRYLSYIRVSKNKQTTENQRAACQERFKLLRKEGDTLLEFDEKDASTHRPLKKRPKLLEMIKTCREGDVLLVTKVDRLARHPKELINIWFELRGLGVTVISLFDPEVNDENICIYAFIACSERKNVSIRTKNDLHQRKLKGERYGKVPYGYELDPNILQLERESANSYGKPYKLVPNAKEQEAIQIMKELYNRGERYSRIVKELEEKGHTTRTGRKISLQQVHSYLNRLPGAPDLSDVAMTH